MILKGNRIHLEGHRYLDTASATVLSVEKCVTSEPVNPAPEGRSTALLQRRIEALQKEILDLKEGLQKSEESLEEAKKAAQKEGFLAGEKNGKEIVRRDLKESFDLLDRMEREFRRTAAAYHENSDKALLRMARWMAEKILAHELPLQGIDGLLKRLRAMLEHWVGETVYRFYLNPEERKNLLESGRDSELVDFCEGRIEWIKSPEIPPGGCRLSLSSGLVDATPAEMLDHIEESLIAALGKRETAEDLQ